MWPCILTTVCGDRRVFTIDGSLGCTAVVAYNAGRMDVSQQQYGAFLNVLKAHEGALAPGLAARRPALESAVLGAL